MLRLGPILAALALLAACTSGDEAPIAEVTPTRDTTATATPPLAATSTPTATPLLQPTPEPWPSSVVDIDANTFLRLADGSSVIPTVIGQFEIGERRSFAEEIEPGPDPAGRYLEREVVSASRSPDGRWVTYRRQLRSAPHIWDQWLLDETTAQLSVLIADVRGCGGCDGSNGGHGFSADSRYLIVDEGADPGRTYLVDLETMNMRVISEGRIPGTPQWSPRGAQLLYSPDGRRLVLEDLTAGTTREPLGLTVPATFDATGHLIYSPAAARLLGPDPSTTVLDAGSLTELIDVPGEPSAGFFGPSTSPVALSPRGLVLALQSAPDCPGGTIVYSPGRDEECFARSLGASVSPNARYVAMAQHGPVGPDYRRDVEWQLLLLDVETRVLRPLATPLLSEVAPAILWSADSALISVTRQFSGP